MSERQSMVAKAMEEFRGKIEELFASGRIAEFLSFAAQFRRYSFQNLLLVFSQRPAASHVAGLRTWNKLGRRVKKGEKGIGILAPVLVKRKDEAKEAEDAEQEQRGQKLVGFRIVSVFDIAQTEGEDVPTILRRLETADTGDLRDRIVAASPVPVEFSGIPEGGPNGAYFPLEKRIVINASLARDMQVKTLLHEIAHAVDAPDVRGADRAVEEVVAEGAAYLAAAHLGLDTSEYSLGYIATWGKDLKQILDAGNRMMAVAERIIERIENAESPAVLAAA